MKFKRLLILTFFILCEALSSAIIDPREERLSPNSVSTSSVLYAALSLSSHGLKESVFKYAINGYEKVVRSGKLLNQSLLSICDFSQSSNQPRLYVIDLDRRLLLFHTLVAHGKKSGDEYAQYFGNLKNSHLSSLGFYVTGEKYQGQHGISLRLNGIEKGFNDQALSRGIVLHGAEYVSSDFIKNNGRLGRSLGCPAVPSRQSAELVSILQGGSCFFIYYPDSNYLKNSRFLSNK